MGKIKPTTTRPPQFKSMPKGVKLLVLMMTLLAIWQVTSFEAAANFTSPLSLTGQFDRKATPADPRRSETTFSLSQTITTTTLSTKLEPVTLSSDVCPAAEEVAVDNSSIQRLLIKRLLSLTGAIFADDAPQKRVNILLLGSDRRPYESYGHTDVIVLVTVDPTAKSAGMLSIPRDLWVTIPGYGENRINQAYRLGEQKKHPGGGAALIEETIEANFGVPIDFYILVDFIGFVQIIDTLGGLDICAPKTVNAAIYYGFQPQVINEAEYYSFTPLPPDEVERIRQNAQGLIDPGSLELGDIFLKDEGYEFLYIKAGPHTLDGVTTLQYVQSRASARADFERVQRQQAVLLAIKNKALQVDIIPKIPRLWVTMNDAVKTNLKLSEIMQLARLVEQIPSANIQTRVIGGDQIIDYTMESGARVLLPQRAAIKTLIDELFGRSNPTAPPTRVELEVNQMGSGQTDSEN